MELNHNDIINKYFPLTEDQQKQFEKLGELYPEWNAKINVISRKDIDNLYIHHVLHSLSIAKFVQFVDGSNILDLGCGGGFPGIPLAILMPKVNFRLIDGTKKKILVVNEVAKALGLKNVHGQHERAEYMEEQFDFVISRAVAKIARLKEWAFPLIRNKNISSIPNGLICLKGGHLKEELKELSKKDYLESISLSSYFEESFFEDKYLLYLQR